MPTLVHPRRSAYDPFGEPVERPGHRDAMPDGYRARNLGVALFWGLALLILAGRVHFAAHAAVPSAAIERPAPTLTR
jgi:hypothetical protein